MQTFDFGPGVGKRVDQYGSDFVISRLIHSDTVHVGCMRLGPGGSVGYHQASGQQLFAVVEGQGWVLGEDGGRVPIKAGEAAFWKRGEYHGAQTDVGMVAIVIEGDVLTARPEEVGPISR